MHCGVDKCAGRTRNRNHINRSACGDIYRTGVKFSLIFSNSYHSRDGGDGRPRPACGSMPNRNSRFQREWGRSRRWDRPVNSVPSWEGKLAHCLASEDRPASSSRLGRKRRFRVEKTAVSRTTSHLGRDSPAQSPALGGKGRSAGRSTCANDGAWIRLGRGNSPEPRRCARNGRKPFSEMCDSPKTGRCASGRRALPGRSVGASRCVRRPKAMGPRASRRVLSDEEPLGQSESRASVFGGCGAFGVGSLPFFVPVLRCRQHAISKEPL